MQQDQPKTLKEIASQTAYPIDAFYFVRRGLDYTVHRIHEQPEKLSEGERHVNGRQLSEGLRDFAIEQYGRLAGIVLRRWRIQRTEDFGSIVFAMVEGGLMQATEEDSAEDFEGVFEFEEAFDVGVPVDKVPPEGLESHPVQQPS